MPTIEVDSWSEFLARVQYLQAAARPRISPTGFSYSDVLFRGVSDHTFELSTTLERYGATGMPVTNYYLAVSDMKVELEAFSDRLWEIPEYTAYHGTLGAVRIHESPITPEVAGYLVHLRHHGFPSPLLDWTESPYVAAYFAFRSKAEQKPDRPERRVAIWAYQEVRGGLKQTTVGPRIFTLGSSGRTHQRHFLQHSQYTVAVTREGSGMRYCPHREAFQESEHMPSVVTEDRHDARFKQDRACRFVLPASLRDEALDYLRLHNVTANSLFPSEEALMETLAFKNLDRGKLYKIMKQVGPTENSS